MASRVVDTDVVSFLFKNDSRAQLYRSHLAGHLLVLSFMTVAELERWAIEHNWGTVRRSRLEESLRNFTIYPFDRAICTKWAEITVMARRNGRPIESKDAWIAATALSHDVPLVTHNRKHYDGVKGLTLISEAPP